MQQFSKAHDSKTSHGVSHTPGLIPKFCDFMHIDEPQKLYIPYWLQHVAPLGDDIPSGSELLS